MRDLCDLSYALQRDLIEDRVANARIAVAVAAAAGADIQQVPDPDEEIAAFDARLMAEPERLDQSRTDLLRALGLR
jgi:hypothetical protein